MALCGMRCLNLHEETIKYSEFIIHTITNLKMTTISKSTFKNWECLKTVVRKEPVKITVFKSLVLSKIAHLALVKSIPPSIINQLNKTQNNFFWNRLNPKIKNLTINNNYKNGGLKKF